MNKYLMLSATALLAGAAGATAATYTFTMTSTGQGCWNGGILHTDVGSHHAAAWTHTNNNCYGGTSEGQGLLTNVKGLGKVYPMSDTYFGKNYGIFSEQLTYVLPAKPVNNARWYLFVGVNGVSSFEANSGILIDVTKSDAPVSLASMNKTTFAVKQMIAAHRGIAK